MRLSIFASVLVVLFTTTLISCKTGEKPNTNIANTLLVQLTDATFISALEVDFKKYKLQQLKVISRPTHIFLFEYNANSISEERLITLLKKSSYVKEAQPNRDLELRKKDTL